MRARRWQYLQYLVAAGLGLLWGIQHLLSWWGGWYWGTDANHAAWVWQRLAARALGERPERGLHILGELAYLLRASDPDPFAVFIRLPKTIALDLLQQVVGSAGRLLGLGADRYQAFSRILQELGPTRSLWLWLLTSAAVGALLGVLALAAARAGLRRLSTAGTRAS